MPIFRRNKKRLKRSKVKDFKNPSSSIRINNSKVKQRKSTNRRRFKPNIKLPKFGRRFSYKMLFRPVTILIIIGMALIAGGVIYASRNLSNFYIKTININHTEYIDPQILDSIKNEYSGKLFFTVFPRNVVVEIESSTPIIKSVEVEKFLPDILEIHIEEREPFSIWMNRSGAYLVSKDNIVVKKLSEFESISLSEEDLAILSDAAAINPPEEDKPEQDNVDETTNKTDTTQEEITTLETDNTDEPQKDLTDEEKAKLEEEAAKQAEIERKQKLAMLAVRKIDLEKQLKEFWKTNSKDIDKSVLSAYLKFYSYDNTKYELWDELNEDTQKAFELAKELSKIKLLGDFNNFLWINNHHLELVYANDKKLIIDPYSYDENLYSNALAVVEDLKKRGEGFKTIDLRGEKIAVK